MSYILVITGSRYAEYAKHLKPAALRAEQFVRREIQDYWAVNGDPEISIHGNAPGVDSVFRDMSLDRFGPDRVISKPADWNTFGPRAGSIRNRAMLDHAEALGRGLDLPVKVLAFLEEQSVGTLHCVNEAAERGLDYKIVKLGDLKGEIEREQKPKFVLGSSLKCRV